MTKENGTSKWREIVLVAGRGRVWKSTLVHLLGLAGLAACYLALSWRRWPDPLIDFGNDLYRPWRIANGAVLYRDMASYYGPLSQHLNALIFALFGPGLMHLVWLNLVIFGAILTTLYCLLRRAWGPGAALGAAAVFVAVFGFSHFISVGNYTYAAPYAHEATHGMLILLFLLAVLSRWLERSDRLDEFLAGLLCGCTAVLKHEIMLAAFLLTAAAVGLRWQRGGSVGRQTAMRWAAGVILPTLFFFGYFAARLPLREAWDAATHVWHHPLATAAVAHDPVELGFLGLDRPWLNLLRHGWATLMAVALVAAVLITGKVADRQANRAEVVAVGGALLLGVLAVGGWAIAWRYVGRCLLGLMLLYLVRAVISLIRRQDPVAPRRILLTVLAAALMARMVLNGRIYQYGFYQAALAGTVLSAVLLGESAEWLRVGQRGRWIIVTGFASLLLTGAVRLTAQSQEVWQLQTLAVGQGADRFYTFQPEVNPTGDIVRRLTEFLGRQDRDQTLLVLPEGLMLNYLTRRPSPVSPFSYFSFYTEQGREAGLVAELRRHSPDLVVLISRDLREYGIRRYGESVGRGQLLLQWVSANYSVLTTIGGDPLDVRQFGAMVFRKKPTGNPDIPAARL